MATTQRMGTALVCGALALALSATACGRDEPSAPAAQIQTETPVQVTEHPMTVTGCLRAGEAANTFVLTAARSTTDEAVTANYELIGTRDVNLQDHIGTQVAVTGVLRSQQSTGIVTPGQPADEEARGTTGKPAVSTQTEVALRQLDVESVKPLEDRCEM